MNTRARKVRKTMQDRNIDCRVHELDWERIGSDLEAQGSAVIETLLMPAECDALAALYSKDEIFRSRVVMARHGFGRGEYKCITQGITIVCTTAAYAIPSGSRSAQARGCCHICCASSAGSG